MRVLLVEDEIDQLELMETIIKDLGHATWKAQRLREAKNILEQQKFDLILLDVFLPDGLGYEIIPDIKTKFPDTQIIVMTGSNSRELEAKVRQTGGVAYYLIKPYEFSTLKMIIGHIASRQRTFT